MLSSAIGYEDPMSKVNQNIVRLGSRGSPLALAQSQMVQAALQCAHSDLQIHLEIIHTTGDRVQDRPLSEIGGKGLFTKEIETSLLEGQIDFAVHSAKDMETRLPDGLALSAAMQREDPRDVFISEKAINLAELPAGALVGTTSLRRRAQILNRFPALQVVPIRGNVDTRLRKMRDGEVDAPLLALAGLRRLGRECDGMTVLDPDYMLPAAAQGAIGIETRAGDDRLISMMAAINHENTFKVISAERALLEALDGNCRTPVGALAELQDDGVLYLRALLADPDGAWLHSTERRGFLEDGVMMGKDAGAELRGLAGGAFFDD